ncbi:GIBBERELLIN-REGULATED PROTEIN 13 [Salix purpurea]|uniref:GIBBERELLIN-REGULATED PROTEIN 13 n=1 Tax=Salix purpurea TaxID=77065 RepID=A0A9Q0Q528_SALPP|nr:GIBBERELLIN-REGULATED PROTEIN 13 [Salix purpurea]
MLRKPSIDVIFPLVLLLLLIVENYVSSLISSISSSMGARWQQHSSLSLSCTTCYRLISQRLQPLSPSQTQTATFHRTAPLKAALILKSVDLAALIDAPRQPSRSHACSSARKCCAKCLCVPAGTYGNKQSCPCYNNWKTKRGGPKCP